jgi:hypothetical protein
VFPSVRSGQPFSDAALDGVLRRMKVDVTTHGFRASFRDWPATTRRLLAT